VSARVLVLGAEGQLGRHVREALTGLSATGLGRRQCDITDERQIAASCAAVDPAIVINCAADTRVDDAETDPACCRRVNETGAGLIAAVCARAGIPLIHFSTDYVFGGTPPRDAAHGYTPDDPPAPVNRYGAAKLAGEQAIREVCQAHWIVRTSWLFSAYPANFARTILRLAREREELRVVDDQRGTPTYAGHLAAACRALVERALAGTAPDYGVYHFAGTPAVSWHGFADAIVADAQARGLLTRRPDVIPVATAEFPRPAPRPADSRLDAGDLIARLQLSPPSWRNGLAEMFKELTPVTSDG
jgi:dTDP-4-dehydrorhamnose reductase